MPKCIGEVECIHCGYCCGYRRDSTFGGVFYSNGEEIPEDVITVAEDNFRIPVDENDVCIYLEKLDNGFNRCKIYDRKPIMCSNHYCLTEKKIKVLRQIIEELKVKCAERDKKVVLLNKGV